MRPATSLIGFSSGSAPDARRHRFIGDAGRARLHQPFGLRLVGGEVEVGEQDVARLEHRDFLRLRLLDLHDHVGAWRTPSAAVGQDRRAGLFIGAVGEIDADAGLGLDEHLMAGGDQLGDRGRGQADPIFVVLDFLRHTDAHGSFAPLMMICAGL